MNPQNAPFQTRILPVDEAAIAEAAHLIGEGQPVAVPTETVYGLAADATNPEAVARIYAAKGRPSFNPLIVHVTSLAQAEVYAEFSAAARAVAEAFWPGALTLVLPLRAEAGLAPAVTAGLATVALRCPAHPAMQALLAASGTPLAAPSANRSGRISPVTAAHVEASLGGSIPLILDGGTAAQGLESTIVRIDAEGAACLRPGPVDFTDVLAVARLAEAEAGSSIQAPGQLASHYAPTKPLRLNASGSEAGEWLIGFGAVAGDESLSASGDLREAAANLFSALHRAEASPAARIAVAGIPETGIGRAINDRLRRAAAPR
ncbi:MAG TPA: L-threonylcarbamoyladenylate synthase [Allosphingosinicella sp.]